MLVACKENKESMMLVDISRYNAGFEEENDTIILDKNSTYKFKQVNLDVRYNR